MQLLPSLTCDCTATHCNITATTLQQRNNTATTLQQHCNNTATTLQQHCNTHMQLLPSLTCDEDKPLLQRYSFKANLWMLVFGFIGNYWCD